MMIDEDTKMNVAIIGSGNIGTALAVDLSSRGHRVKIYSSRPERFEKKIRYIDMDDSSSFEAEISLVSDDYQEVLSDAEIVFIALPTFLVNNCIDHIIPYTSSNSTIGFIPGAGGIEYLSSQLLERGCTIFGFERVPYVARLETYGKTVMASKKPLCRIASIPKEKSGSICKMISALLGMPCHPMMGFISMTLTPSLHYSRLYDLFKDYRPGYVYDRNPYFYKEWRDSASYITFELDKELHCVCDALISNGIDAREIVPYPVHYESETPEKLTQKLKSINSLKNIKSPLIETGDGKYTLDLDSRYFTESYPFRLCIVKGIADIMDVKVTKIDKVITWYQNLANKEYLVGEKIIGKDKNDCNIPQNQGIFTVDQLRQFYLS